MARRRYLDLDDLGLEADTRPMRVVGGNLFRDFAGQVFSSNFDRTQFGELPPGSLVEVRADGLTPVGSAHREGQAFDVRSNPFSPMSMMSNRQPRDMTQGEWALLSDKEQQVALTPDPIHTIETGLRIGSLTSGIMSPLIGQPSRVNLKQEDLDRMESAGMHKKTIQMLEARMREAEDRNSQLMAELAAKKQEWYLSAVGILDDKEMLK